MRSVLDWFHSTLGLSWAWSIVATTVVVRMLLVPLTVRQIHSMQNLQRFAPQMKEIQKKYKQDKQKQNEELMKFYKENQINPAASCLPMLFQFPVFIALYYALRHFNQHPPGGAAALAHHDFAWLQFVPDITQHTTSFWGGYVLLVVYVGEPDGVDALHVGHRGQDAAHALHDHAAGVRLRDRALPGRPRSLLGDDEPLDGRPGSDHAPADAEDAAADLRAPQLEDAAEGRGAAARAGGAAAEAVAAAGPAGAAEEAGRAAMTEELTVEATGETVGEAKWAALRELEQRFPGLDKAAVRFEVVSEGERGLLGVGYAPARVLAALSAEAAEAAHAAIEEGGPAADARALVMRIVAAFGIEARVDVHEDDETVVVTCSGPDVALLIGRHGQTIDAVQYLLNAIGHRTYGDERKQVVVDAAGYRERRRETLESLALRAAERVHATGEREELEPMTAVERKVVHERLKDVGGVATTSEGVEPNRYVVVLPA